MPLIQDTIFMQRLAPKLERCRRKSQYLWNFRCPLCGDSRVSSTKKRGYVYRIKDNLVFHCHNCNTTHVFGNFLRKVDPLLYNDYVMETFKSKGKSNTEIENETFATNTATRIVTGINLPKIIDLEKNHFARVYCEKRKIPREWLERIYYSSDFKLLIQEMIPDYSSRSYSLVENDPRIIIPVLDENQKLIALQGRALLETKKAKYVTIKFDETSKKIFGLDRVDKSKRVYILEGPINSIFLSNSIATMDSALYNVAALFPIATYISDNQPDNKDIKKVMRKIIDLDLDIFIWPPELKKYKDINDAIMDGYTSSRMMDIIDKNTFRGLKAQLHMQEWMK